MIYDLFNLVKRGLFVIKSSAQQRNITFFGVSDNKRRYFAAGVLR